jgi:hypothetical protein
MANFRHLYCDFWTDEKIMDDFTPEDKLFYLYLLTNSKTTQIGIYPFIKRMVAAELGYSTDTISNLLERFEKYHKLIKYNLKTKEICILNWGKYNLWKGGTPILCCIKAELKKIKDSFLVEEIIKNSENRINSGILLTLNKYLDDTNRGTSRDTIRGTSRGEKENENENENKKNKPFLSEQNSDEGNLPEASPEEIKKAKYLFDSKEFQLAKYLFEFIKNNNASTKEPNFQTWTKHIDLMIRRDKRDPTEIRRVIEWCQKDSFWMCNILSTAKLREKYDQLILKMKNKSSSTTTNKPQQATNYEQREYTDEYFEKLYENLGGS